MRRVLIVLLVLPLAACATRGLGTTRELVDARAAYAQAAAGPATTEAPRSLARARSALAEAEEENRVNPGSARERNLAYLARRRVEAAIADANARLAQREAQIARETLRNKTAETARALEAARAEADRAQARADAATRQAQTEATHRQAAEAAAATARMSLEQAEAALADVRRQLARAGTQLDDQTRLLREREAALQTQVDTLRAERDKIERERDDALAKIKAIGEVTEDDRALVLTIPGEVLFRQGQARLLPRAKEKLDALAEAMLELGGDQAFMIEGHTDSRGSAASNLRLSRLRAMAVRSYLIKRGVDGDQIRAVGRGEHQPVASNSDPEGRANNRRVEIIVTPPAVSRR